MHHLALGFKDLGPRAPRLVVSLSSAGIAGTQLLFGSWDSNLSPQNRKCLAGPFLRHVLSPWVILPLLISLLYSFSSFSN